MLAQKYLAGTDNVEMRTKLPLYNSCLSSRDFCKLPTPVTYSFPTASSSALLQGSIDRKLQSRTYVLNTVQKSSKLNPKLDISPCLAL